MTTSPILTQVEQSRATEFSPLDLLRNIPPELRAVPQHVNWRRERRGDKWTKVPYQPSGALAESNNPRTYSTHDHVVAAYLRGGFDGVGFVFTGHDRYCGIDFDDDGAGRPAINADGTLRPDVAAYVAALDSYTERSQSGKGIHVIVSAELPGGHGRKSAQRGIEVYDRGRFFVMTGDVWPNTPRTIQPRQAQVAQLLAEVFPAKATPTVRPLKHPNGVPGIPTPTATDAPTVGDSVLLERVCASPAGWHLFMNGTGRGSASELDWRLACLLFEAGATFDQADRVFRRSALMRSKWDEPHGLMTYGQLTLAKAQGHTEAQRSAAQGGE